MCAHELVYSHVVDGDSLDQGQKMLHLETYKYIFELIKNDDAPSSKHIIVETALGLIQSEISTINSEFVHEDYKKKKNDI